jgi:hypothetical protein
MVGVLVLERGSLKLFAYQGEACIQADECYLVLVRTPLFTFVRPLVLLIFIILTCFVCIVLIRFLHQELTKGAKWT